MIPGSGPAGGGGQRALTLLPTSFARDRLPSPEMPFLVLQTPTHQPNLGLFLTLVCVFRKQIF